MMFTSILQIMRQPEEPPSNHSQRYLRLLLSLTAITLTSLLLPGCRSENTTPWVPVLEETGFSYLEETAKTIREAQQQAQQDLAAGRTGEAQASLRLAEKAAAVLVFYDIPITEVRQLVNDAGRLYAMGRQKQSISKLDRAASLMQQIGEGDGPVLLSQAVEVLRLMNDLRLAMVENPETVPEKFTKLGHKVNMMALKSRLVLSGAVFSGKDRDQDSP